jgi:hypothetical protein
VDPNPENPTAPTIWATPPPEPPPIGPGEPIEAADLKRVDGLEVLGQATANARRVNPNAILVALNIGPIRDGTVDATSDDRPLRFEFDYAYRDETLPAGQDTRTGRIRVTATKGRFQTTLEEGITSLATGVKALEQPACSLKRVWRGLVHTGVLAEDSSPFLSYSVSYMGGQPHERWILTKAAGAATQTILIPECVTRRPSNNPSSSQLEVPILGVPNLDRAELLSILPQARALALRFDEHMVLRELRAEPVVNGVVNLNAAGRVEYGFAYRYLDPASPPGRDEERVGEITISGQRGRLVVLGHWLRGSPRPGPAPTEPSCGVEMAWQAAVASGVPASDPARITWPFYVHSSGSDRAAWHLEVSGVSQYTRELDVASCKQLGGAKPAAKGDIQSNVVNPWLPKPKSGR